MRVARGVAMWGVATLAAGLAPGALRPELTAISSASGAGLAGVLRTAAAVLLLGCLLWWWAAATAVLASAARGRFERPAGCPRWLHRVLVLGLGLGLAAGLSGPATAGHGTGTAGPGTAGPGTTAGPSTPAPRSAAGPAARLHGLPFPDRPAGALPPLPPPAPVASALGAGSGARPAGARPASPARRWVVRPGDTLWAISVEELPSDVSAARIDDHWRELYRLNRSTIGADPDLLVPGTVLQLPPAPPSPTDREEHR